MRRLPRVVTNELRHAHGVRKLVKVAQPAAGADWSVVVEGGRMWRLLGGSATFLASGAVANRNLGITVTSRGVPLAVSYNATAIVAGQTVTPVYQLGTSIGLTAAIRGLYPVTFQPLLLENGDVVSSVTGAVDVADQYSAISLLVEELWFTNQDLNDEEVLIEHVLHDLESGGGRR